MGDRTTGKSKPNIIQNFTDSYKAEGLEEEHLQRMGTLRENMIHKPFSSDQEKQLDDYIEAISKKVFKSYLPEISTSHYAVADEKHFAESRRDRLRILKIDRWVTDPSERDIDKLVNTYNTLASSPCRFALLFNHTIHGCTVYMAVFSTESNDDPSVADSLLTRFQKALQGNFSGVGVSEERDRTMLDRFFEKSGQCNQSTVKSSLAIVTNIATEKSEKFISQGIEKLIDAHVPSKLAEEYTIMLLCDPMSQAEIDNERMSISQYYTALSAFATWQSNSNATETVNYMKSIATGGAVGANIGIKIAGASLSANVSRSNATGETTSAGHGFTRTYTNHYVKTLLERLDQQMQRLAQCEALGMWRFAAYVVSDELAVTENVAQMYRALTQGKSSYIEKTSVNIWGNLDGSNTDTLSRITAYLKRLEHPRFLPPSEPSPESAVYATAFISGVEMAQALNMPRKSIQSLPVIHCAEFARNVTMATAAPGRAGPPAGISLGKIYHMRKLEQTDVALDKHKLTSHTFITGSTGSGKSNTIYTLLDRLCADGENTTKFLVIEPAKGEYKDAFGGREDVTVYGTNLCKAPYLLQLNPFSFPDDIHVLEHVDRLVEVFNACWPMYAAMPAILRESIERAYEEVGWNLKFSKTQTPGVFPTFDTLLAMLPTVVESSQYSADTSNDYKGALVTRVRSLTRGIHGLLFKEDIPNERLFGENVIADISRIGSQETKALIMGILILKLQEFRMAENVSHNSRLRHITVLEEAHNLLRRTSDKQSQESANLQGKSVEMLTNAIAEMRSYGEGFIIADQAPGLLDMAVIRNTNTKLIMRLPDESDRLLVGKASGLNDEQIVELSRLEVGVAAISQSDWLEPVLCKVDKFENEKALPPMQKPPERLLQDEESLAVRDFLHVALDIEREKLSLDTVDKIRKWSRRIGMSEEGKHLCELVLSGSPLEHPAERYGLFGEIANAQLLSRLEQVDALSEMKNYFYTQYGLQENSLLIQSFEQAFQQVHNGEYLELKRRTYV